MKTTELTTEFHPWLLEFWQHQEDRNLPQLWEKDDCLLASQELLEFLEEQKRIFTAEIILIGGWKSNQKTDGWFQADVPDYSLDALRARDKQEMKAQNLNPAKRKDRITYAQNANLVEEFKLIPHSWVEYKGEILDPSGFHPSGKGQFDNVVFNKQRLKDRYLIF